MQSRSSSPADALDPAFARARRSDWVRLRTLILLRWIAIVGQIAAIFVGTRIFGLSIEPGLVYVAIGAAIITNLLATFLYPKTKRLSESELAGMLMFDMLQLSSLLALTGGLHNPFVLLILTQVAIAATALRGRCTLLVCGLAITLVTLLHRVHYPLVTAEGEILRLPDLFVFGFWAAIVVGIVFQAG